MAKTKRIAEVTPTMGASKGKPKRTTAQKVQALRDMQSHFVLKRMVCIDNIEAGKTEYQDVLTQLDEWIDAIHEIVGDLRKMQGIANTFRSILDGIDDGGEQ